MVNSINQMLVGTRVSRMVFDMPCCVWSSLLHFDALVASLKRHTLVATWQCSMFLLWMHMRLGCHEGYLQCTCVCSSCGCIRNNTQETDFGGNMGVTTCLLMCVFWMHVRFGCQQYLLICVGVHAVHVVASVEKLMGQVACRNTGVTNGLCDVLVRMLLV